MLINNTKLNNELIIIKYLGEEEEITIPEIVDGYKVTGIENYAFQYNNIKKIFLSKIGRASCRERV